MMPVIWKNADAKPKLCFIGCPHLSLYQLRDWTQRLGKALTAHGRQKVAIPTVFTTAPGVLETFRKTQDYERCVQMGVVLSCICPLMYMDNPLCSKKPVITNSNKLRTYSSARYEKDDEILEMIAGGSKR